MDNSYAREITRQAVARACTAFNFKKANSDCIDVLADVIKYYIRTVAVAARDEAENSGRVCAGIQDVLKVLDQDPVSCFYFISMQLYELKICLAGI
jgi:histone H3/H4